MSLAGSRRDNVCAAPQDPEEIKRQDQQHLDPARKRRKPRGFLGFSLGARAIHLGRRRQWRGRRIGAARRRRRGKEAK